VELTAVIVYAAWLTFAAYWFVGALRTKPVSVRTSRSRSFIHRAPLVASYWLLTGWHVPLALNAPVSSGALWLRIAGDAICVLGVAIAIAARRTLAGNWSSAGTLKEGHELIRTGVYRVVRHPIYTGILTIALGTAVEIGRVRGYVAFGLMVVSFWIKSKHEERLLLEHFPADYPAYKRETKALIPFVL
jgi:protein-S-isoprenylcysteine O-methyltransferase Ste14